MDLDTLSRWFFYGLGTLWFAFIGLIAVAAIRDGIVWLYKHLWPWRDRRTSGDFYEAHVRSLWRRREAKELEIMEATGHPMWDPKEPPGQ